MKSISLSAGQYMVIVDTLLGSVRLSDGCTLFNYTNATRQNLYEDIIMQMQNIELSEPPKEGLEMNTLPVKQKPRTKVQLEKELAHSLSLNVKEAEFITSLKLILSKETEKLIEAHQEYNRLQKQYNKIPKWIRKLYHA
jgi:hypothetical protein